jgi:hypothetical protein
MVHRNSNEIILKLAHTNIYACVYIHILSYNLFNIELENTGYITQPVQYKYIKSLYIMELPVFLGRR